MRSRSGAKLKYTEQDIAQLCAKTPTYGSHADEEPKKILLTDPKKSEVIESIKALAAHLCAGGHAGKQALNIFYAGHGSPVDGGWHLKDGTLSGEETAKIIVNSYKICGGRLHVNLVLDSCYSARFLIDMLVALKDNESIYPLDCVASSMVDEKSWEMDFIQHGAMSYSLTHAGNAHVDSADLAKAIDNQDRATVVKALQGMGVPSPVTFLTDGKQHSVELTSGHLIEVVGAGRVELSDHLDVLTHAGLADCLYRAQSAYKQDVCYEHD